MLWTGAALRWPNARTLRRKSGAGGAIVLARRITPSEFALPEHPTLGGVPIARWISQPRSLKPDGTPDLNVFAFHLVTASDVARLPVGQIVELSGADQGAGT